MYNSTCSARAHQHRVQTTTARTHSPPDNPRALHVSQLRISRDPSTTGPNAHSARPLSFSRLAALSHPREPETRDTAQLSLAPQADPRKQSNTRNNSSPAPIPERNDTNRHQYSPKAATPSQQHILLIFSKPGLQQTATTPLRRHNTQHQNVLISSTTQHKRRHQRQQPIGAHIHSPLRGAPYKKPRRLSQPHKQPQPRNICHHQKPLPSPHQ